MIKKNRMIYRVVIFLIINFGALGIGSIFTNDGVNSQWYANLNKAPWTPPGWMFGVAWTVIMISFSIFMAYGWHKVSNKSRFVILFAIQWVLNVSWNPVFFYYQQVLIGFIVILALTILLGFFIKYYHQKIKPYSYLLWPYFIWLLIATSLNGYILLNH